MERKIIKASRFRLEVLRAYRGVWEKAPSDKQFVITQELWSPIWNKWKGDVTHEFASAVIASLHEDGLVENIVAPDPDGKSTPLSRITDKGLTFLSDLEGAVITRRIAILGAVTGCLGFLISVIDLVAKIG